ncbi:aldo/keto reductase [Acidaminobacterium chupaoyuni]
METVLLNNGVQMPLVGLGTYGLQGDGCRDVVAGAIGMGYTLLDTAQMYGNEEEVGRGMQKSGAARSSLFLTTKIYRISNSYEKAKEAIDSSLKRLGTEYVDLLLLHEPYREGPEMYRAMEEALKTGKARAIGISNYNEAWYDDLIGKVSVTPAVNQLEVHPYFQKKDWQAKLEKEGVRVQAWSPLAQGKEELFNHPVLKEIGKRHGKTAAQVVLRALTERKISVIPKSAKEERLSENMDIFDFSLSAEEKKAIEKLDRNQTLFPWTEKFILQ